MIKPQVKAVPTSGNQRPPQPRAPFITDAIRLHLPLVNTTTGSGARLLDVDAVLRRVEGERVEGKR